MSEQQIRALDCWDGPICISPLEGGITNHNYVVECAGSNYVARACLDLEHLGIDRRNEVACQSFAARLGLAPAIVHHQDSVIVSDFVVGKTLTKDDVCDTDRLSRVATALRQLHDSRDQLEGVLLYFSAFQTVRTYAATARELGAELPQDIAELIADARVLEGEMARFEPALCHNDLLPANLIDSGQRLWFVDWEYGGVGNPLFDLAGLSGNCDLDDQQERALLEAYLGADARPEEVEQERRDLRRLKVASLLREALWSVIQTKKSRIEFDYHKYARDNLDAYRIARSEIE